MKGLELFFNQYVPNWQQESFLLAVSGGVDSMVLLESFSQLKKKIETIHFSVVHIHHHLRKESDEEEEMVRNFCGERNISIEVYHWEQGFEQTAGIEEKARKFRYQKLKDSMKKNNVRYVVVAHHADDQAETVLMKLIIPLFKQENSKFNQKIHEFTKTLQEQQEVILMLANQWMEQELLELHNGFSWDKERYIKQPVGLQKVILVELSKKLGGLLSAKNVLDIQEAIISDTSQMSLNLPKGWIFQKRYDQLSIIKELKKESIYQEIIVEGFESADIVLSEDESISFKAEQGWEMFVSMEDFPLTIRRRKQNDRFLLTENQHQSIRRWCINQKIPKEEREKLWIVENSSKEIIAILGFRKTQSLSKRKETDRIRIVYRKKKRCYHVR